MHPIARRLTVRALTALILVVASSIVDLANAQRRSEGGRDEFRLSRKASPPLMAIIALNQQRVTVYDADGRLLRAPVSTGQTGYETPAGIYSVLEKNREHYSNLYDGASMPFMQRLTWSGIALHAGVLPGRPASHGCIRMPHEFAKELFDLTKVGLRVIVVRDDTAPVDITYPVPFKPGPIRSEVALAPEVARPSAGIDSQLMPLGGAPSADAGAARAQTWRSIARVKAAEAEAAAQRAAETRRAAARAASEAALFTKQLRLAEGAKLKAEVQLEHAKQAAETASTPAAIEKAEVMKTKVLERLAAAQAQLDAVKGAGQPKINAAAIARDAAEAAETAKVSAQNDAKLAQAKIAPVSVFISRKTQRLYVRQAFQPLFESALTIRDPDTPIGTTIFTALHYTSEAEDADLRWSAVSMYANTAIPEPTSGSRVHHGSNRNVEPGRINPYAARVALGRISIPQETIDRINEVLSPGSSLIISDEGLSRETGKGTDFVVLMSGEPQGGIKMRRRNSYAGNRDERPFRRSPYYGNTPSLWW
jgi:hypothetical protein